MLETLSPQEAMTLFRNGGAFFVDVRTEKEFLKRAIPGCPLVPLDKLEREGGLDSRFSGKPVVFFAAREAGRRIRPSSWKEAPRASVSAWGRDSRLGTGGISGLEHTRAAALFCAGTGFYLRGSCLTPVFYLSLAPSALLFLLERGAFLCLSSVEIAQKGWQRLTENRKCSQMVGRGRECRPLHVAPLPAFVMVSVICCYYGYCLKRVSPSHPQENPEVREYGFGARFRHPVGVAQ